MSTRPVALITGASSGIGQAFAEAFAQQGFNLILTGRRQDLLEKNAHFFEQHYHIFCEFLCLELSSLEAIEALAEKIQDRSIEVLVNNAGFGLKGAFPEQNVDDILKMLRLHILCTTRLTQAILPQMLSRNSGTIINVASDAAYVIVPGNAFYSGTKAFIKQFTEGLYLDLRSMGSAIRIQALCPGLTKTDFQLKMGMPKAKQVNQGLMHWEEPQRVVSRSLKALERNQPVCIGGGMMGRAENWLTRFLPPKLYYSLILKCFPLHPSR